jgi:anti-anti-sigma factor
MALNIEISKGEAGTYQVNLAGTLDTKTTEELDKRMVDVWADAKARSIRLDMHELSFISSAGLGLVARMRKTAMARGGGAGDGGGEAADHEGV